MPWNVRFKSGVNNPVRNYHNRAGRRRYAVFFVKTWLNACNRLWIIHLDGWRTGQLHLSLARLLVSLALSPPTFSLIEIHVTRICCKNYQVYVFECSRLSRRDQFIKKQILRMFQTRFFFKSSSVSVSVLPMFVALLAVVHEKPVWP